MFWFSSVTLAHTNDLVILPARGPSSTVFFMCTVDPFRLKNWPTLYLELLKYRDDLTQNTQLTPPPQKIDSRLSFFSSHKLRNQKIGLRLLSSSSKLGTTTIFI
jgi:hypothetical protein